MDENILWMTAVVDRTAALDKREEEDFMYCMQEDNQSVIKRREIFMQAEERVREISSDLRREIVDLGGAENIIKLQLPKTYWIDFLKGAMKEIQTGGGSLSALTILQERGAEINDRDKLISPLHGATRTGHSDMVQHLLASGININAKDWEGDTALHDAVKLNQYQIIKLLILTGANMQIKNAEGKQVKFNTKETLEKLEQMREVGLA
uniref:Ankyrin repeat domain 2 (stretch responsive muscle) n=3 Tax=Cyprinus carpio TaxID=7962 RepID=A0A9J8C6F7_CYPCA